MTIGPIGPSAQLKGHFGPAGSCSEGELSDIGERRRTGVVPSTRRVVLEVAYRTTSDLIVVSDPQRSNQSMPSHTRSNFKE